MPSLDTVAYVSNLHHNFSAFPAAPAKPHARPIGVIGLILLVSGVALSVTSAAESATAKTPAPASDKPSAIQVAGELIVSLDARDASAGSKVWTNQGAIGPFSRLAAP